MSETEHADTTAPAKDDSTADSEEGGQDESTTDTAVDTVAAVPVAAAPVVVPAVPAVSLHPADIPLIERPFKQQLLTPDFWLVALYLSVLVLQLNFYMGSVGDQLLSLAQGTDVDSAAYVKAFGLILPIGGVCSAPLLGVFIDRVSRPVSFAVVVLIDWVLIVMTVRLSLSLPAVFLSVGSLRTLSFGLRTYLNLDLGMCFCRCRNIFPFLSSFRILSLSSDL